MEALFQTEFLSEVMRSNPAHQLFFSNTKMIYDLILISRLPKVAPPS